MPEDQKHSARDATDKPMTKPLDRFALSRLQAVDPHTFTCMAGVVLETEPEETGNVAASSLS